MAQTSTNTRDVQALANPKTFKERDAWTRAVLASNLSNGVMRLAVRLALHLNVETGRCDPGYDALSSELRLSRRSIIRDVAVLEQAGWVSVARWRQHQTSQFSLLRADRGDEALSPLKQAPEVTNSVARGDICCHPTKRREKRGRFSPPNSSSPRVSKTDAKAKAAGGKQRRGKVDAADVGFTAFWSAYPKRVAEDAALKAFIVAVQRGVDPEVLIAGAKRYAIERAEEDPRYTKHPATWLNGGCWTDETAGPPVLDNAGNIIAFAGRGHEPEPTEAEIRRAWGPHSRADEMLLRERGYGRA
jgi:hypothetical protein